VEEDDLLGSMGKADSTITTTIWRSLGSWGTCLHPNQNQGGLRERKREMEGLEIF
jgi:hypothetical protein